MKHPEPATTVARLAELLGEGGMLSADALRTALNLWQHDPTDGPDVARFAHWLVVHGYVTEAEIEPLVGRVRSAPRRPAIVARPAAPRADRADVPTAVPAAPRPPEPPITAELAPADPSDISVELVSAEPPPYAAPPLPDFAIAPDVAIVTPPPPPVPRTNATLWLLLGALGLLIAETIGWLLGYATSVLLFGW